MDDYWKTWEPRERATLCFLIQDGQILLIRKKRGLGAGKINGPGGRIEPGEEPHECAVRETSEEVGLTPRNVQNRGELHFQFADGYSLHCTVFTADSFSGTLIETDEALPIWTAIDAIPYHEMWADDIHWFHFLLSSTPFRGFFDFDNDTMLSCLVES
jgi:8-oxo-dGTP diphosphatase